MPRQAKSTRDRILDAAVVRFSKQSYEDTGLRAIAADVGVDVAYVHRCFGSKQRLFTAAIEAALRLDSGIADMPGDIEQTLARLLVERTNGQSADTVSPLDIVIRSLASREATQALHRYVLKDFINPIASRLKPPANQRATLIVALLAGIGILKNVLGIAPLIDMEPGGLETLIANAIKGVMDAVLETSPR